MLQEQFALRYLQKCKLCTFVSSATSVWNKVDRWVNCYQRVTMATVTMLTTALPRRSTCWYCYGQQKRATDIKQTTDICTRA